MATVGDLADRETLEETTGEDGDINVDPSDKVPIEGSFGRGGLPFNSLPGVLVILLGLSV